MYSYSTENPKQINRAALERLRDQLLSPMQTEPPTILSYPRELDVELFRLFVDDNAPIVRREKLVTLSRRKTWKPIDVWAYEVEGSFIDYFDDDGTWVNKYAKYGEVQDDGTWLTVPDVREVPRYTDNTDDAYSLKAAVIGVGGERRLIVEEIDDDYFTPLWCAKIVDVSNQIVGEGETCNCAASIVLAILCDLIANDGASYWIKVAEEDK